MSPQTLSRRERLRAETTAEIKSVAMDLITACGPDAVSLRAIAREMGMTANAIYSYFPTRDDLVTTLIEDLYTSLADTLDATRDTKPADDAAGCLLVWAEAFRSWALDNPCGFRLIYGDPVPGYRAPEGGAAPEAHRRVLAGLAQLVAAAPSAPDDQDNIYEWSDFDPGLIAATRERLPGAEPAVVALALRIWARIHGLVAFETYGHLGSRTHVVGKLYLADMHDLLRSLDLTPPG